MSEKHMNTARLLSAIIGAGPDEQKVAIIAIALAKAEFAGMSTAAEIAASYSDGQDKTVKATVIAKAIREHATRTLSKAAEETQP